MTDDLTLADAIDPKAEPGTNILTRKQVSDLHAVGIVLAQRDDLQAAADALRTRHQPAEIARRATIEEIKALCEEHYNLADCAEKVSGPFAWKSACDQFSEKLEALPAPLDVEAMVERLCDIMHPILVAESDGESEFVRLDSIEESARAVLFSIIGDGK